ncbi:MAG TPA: FG-GAP-like repeat-containing protein, partial [Kofleriaceae bacterium]|nr:FG-GAP-like repeat-containing protein [Kofleriaceae bacterium]
MVSAVVVLVAAAATGGHAQSPPTGAIAPTAITLPGGPGSVTGLGRPAELDLFSAQVGYSVPIKLPSGGGMSPSISLSYSGALGNGPFGIGWSLTTPAIRRSLRKGVPHYDDSDELTIEGLGAGRLVPIGDERYLLEGSGAMRVRRLGNYFEVTDSNGTRYYFGHTTAARQFDGTRIAAWYLEEAIDLAGEKARFEYVTDRGEVYLHRVVWGPDERYRLDVLLDARPDTATSFATGFEVTVARRIAELRSSVVLPGAQPEELSRYTFGYADQNSDPADDGPLSRLTDVTMTGRRDAQGVLQPGATMPPLHFTYTVPDAPRAWAIAAGGWVLEQRGVTLLDVDGDGADDLVRFEPGSTAWRRNRAGAFETERTFSGADGVELSQIRLLDVDGDARPEVVRVVDDEWRAYSIAGDGLGPGRALTGTRAVPLFGADSVLADINGDGRTDVVEAVTSGVRIHLGVPLGLGPSWYAPPISAADVGVAPGAQNVRFLDANGDGIADVVWLTDGWMKLFLGRGDGTFAAFTKILYPWGAGAFPLDHIHLVDLDRDGVLDLVRVDAGKVRWFAGRAGFTFDAIPRVLDRPAGSDTDVRITFADVDGNGSEDVVWSNLATMWSLDLAGGTTRSMIRTIDDGMGELTTISYGTSTQLAWFDEAAGARWSSFVPRAIAIPVRQDTTYADGTPSRVVDSTARDGFWDGGERRFGGFLGARATLPGDSPNDERVEISRFLAGTGAERVLRGKPAEVRTEDGGGRIFAVASSTWAAVRPASLAGATDPDNPLLARPELLSVVTSNYEGVSSPIVTQTDHVYDMEARPIEDREYGRLDLAGDERTTTRQFASDDTTWVRDRVIDEALYQGIGTSAATLVSHTRHYFGGDAGDPLPLGQVGFGWPRADEALLWSSSTPARWVTTGTIKYDHLGNVIERVDGPPGVGVVHRFGYDPAGLFPITEGTIASPTTTITWSAVWDPVLGVATEVADPMGNITHVSYDGLGRVTSLSQNAWPAHAHYVYDWSAPRPRTFSYIYDGELRALPAYGSQWQRTDHYAFWRHTVTVADSSGETLYSGGQLATNTWLISGWKRKDARGRVSELLDTFTSTGPALPGAPPPGLRRQQIHYDALDRVVEQILPSGARTQRSYRAFETSVAVDGLAPVTSRFDGLGRALHTERAIGTTVESVDASYDAADRVTAFELQRPGDPGLPAPCTMDPAHARVSHCFRYDSFGRLVEADDPDVGLRQMTYDDAGRLVRHVNGAGQGLTLAYDAAGRLVLRRADDGTKFEYHYDVDFAGGKHPGQLWYVVEPTGIVKFTYDELGRRNYEVRTNGSVAIFHDMVYAASGVLMAERYVRDWKYVLARDMAGRVTRVDGVAGPVSTPLWTATSFDDAGRLTAEKFGNGVVGSYGFDDNGQVSHVRVQRSAGGTSLYDVTLARNAYGAVTSAVDGDGVGLDHSATFDYDPAGRLTSAVLGSAPKSGELDRRFGFTYAYDGLQNMISRQQPQGPRALGQYGGVQCYGENGAGPRQLTSVVTGTATSCGSNGATVVATMTYDDAGRQITDGATRMTYNALDQLAAVDLAGGGHVAYTYGYDGLRIGATDNLGGVAEHWMTPDVREQGGDYDEYVRVGDRIVARVHLHYNNAVATSSDGVVAGAMSARIVATFVLGACALLSVLGVCAAPRRRRLRPVLASALIAALLVPACAPTIGASATDLWQPVSITYFHTGFAAGPVLL